jgi:hypothetical protein
MKLTFFPLRELVWMTLLPVCALPAAELVYEPFDYPAENMLSGGDGGSGWYNAWTQDAQGGESGVVRSEGLNYTDGVGNVLETSGLSMDTAGVDTTRNFRELEELEYNNVWISFLYNLSETNNLFEGITFYLSTTEKFWVSNPSTSQGSEINLSNRVNPGVNVNTEKGEFEQTHFVVMKVSAGVDGADDTVEIFIDPVLSAVPSQPDGVITASDFTFNKIRVAGQSGSSLFFDEFRVGETFGDVAPFDGTPVVDSDGDGLTDSQEEVLGLDPNVSDADLIAAIKEHPDFLGLYDDAGILAQDKGGIIIPKADAEPVDFMFEVQESPNLIDWQAIETYQRSIELPDGKNFLRVSFSDN